jgi:hypothetical protein
VTGDAKSFYNSPGFFVIKLFLGIYIIVLFIDIVLLLVSRDVRGNIREALSGMNIPAELTGKKKKMRERWKLIRKRLGSDNESEYKVAIIEADNIIDEMIMKMKFTGENMGERLGNIPPGQIESLDKLKEAHDVRNRIIHEANFQVNRAYAEEIMKKYEAFLEEFEVL